MFESLSDRLSQSLRGISGKARLSEENIQDTLREVRMALLEADVALPVVKDFVEAIKQRAVGQEVMSSLSPGQAFLKIVQTELEEVMALSDRIIVMHAGRIAGEFDAATATSTELGMAMLGSGAGA